MLVAWEVYVGDQVKFILDEKDIPKAWYNLAADLPKPLPPVLHPGTKQPIGPADLEPLFPMALILQEVWRSGLSISPSRSATSIACGGRRR